MERTTISFKTIHTNGSIIKLGGYLYERDEHLCMDDDEGVVWQFPLNLIGEERVLFANRLNAYRFAERLLGWEQGKAAVRAHVLTAVGAFKYIEEYVDVAIEKALEKADEKA